MITKKTTYKTKEAEPSQPGQLQTSFTPLWHRSAPSKSAPHKPSMQTHPAPSPRHVQQAAPTATLAVSGRRAGGLMKHVPPARRPARSRLIDSYILHSCSATNAIQEKPRGTDLPPRRSRVNDFFNRDLICYRAFSIRMVPLFYL